MSLQFVGAVVALCPMVIESSLLPSIMARALTHRGKKPIGRPKRRLLGQGETYSVRIKAEFSKADIGGLEGGDWVIVSIQMVHGYPLVFYMGKEADYVFCFRSLFNKWYNKKCNVFVCF